MLTKAELKAAATAELLAYGITLVRRRKCDADLKAATKEVLAEIRIILQDALTILDSGPTKYGEKQNEPKSSHNQNIRRRAAS